jgi:hypothetical protein
MRNRTSRLPHATLLALLLLSACGPSDEERVASRAEAIEVVEAFGRRIVNVNLLADSIGQITDAIRNNYGPYVTTLLLGGWLSDPGSAPGRETSNPWPAGIEVRDAEPISRYGYDVTGDILYVTQVDGDPVLRTPIRARVVRGPDDIWRISEWEFAPAR